MKLAFSTLGLPGAPTDQVIAIAAEHGFQGVELRVDDGETVHPGLAPDAARAVGRQYADAGIEVLSIAGYVRVVDPEVSDAEVVDRALHQVRLAEAVGARYLRVFPGGRRPSLPVDDERASRRLARIVQGARDAGVVVALETHDSHGRGSDVRRILDGPGCAEAVAVWDALHTWLNDEPTDATAELLGSRLGYVQVKDVLGRDDLTPTVPGTGVLPLGPVVTALRDTGYDGWLSWEYERAWHPQAPAFEQVTARAISWMRAAAR